MKRTVITLLFIASYFSFSPAGAQTLEACQQAAEQNYPLIRQYDLLAKTTALTVANIQKGWLPQVQATAQATLQSDVTAWPDQMKGLLQQVGVNLKGLSKDQYRVGIDVQQTLIDGGVISSQKEIARRQGDVEQAQNAVNIYNVRKRVNELYFALLLMDEQLRLKADLLELLKGNERQLASMLEHGTASESDFSAMEAERLGAEQQLVSLQSQRLTLQRMLSLFCGIEVDSLECRVESGEFATAVPEALGQSAAANSTLSTFHSPLNRPELHVIDARLRLADAQERALDARLMPRLGVFAQGFYGYPGLNMFEDMLRRRWSLNGLVGARLTWNIGALYTRKNDKARIRLQRESAEVSREVFLFNNRQEQLQQSDDVERYWHLMTSDAEIISLRTKVRQAAESKLAHGIIDVNSLLSELNAENAARVQQSVHKIEMLKEMYDLKYTTNN